MRNTRTYVAGHIGLVGRALVRRLRRAGANLILATRAECDLRRQREVEFLFSSRRPEVVYLAAGTVGGIQGNIDRPGTFIYDNLAIVTNVLEAARVHGVGKLIFLGSSCIYPRDAAQPIAEGALLSGPLEESNQAYAVAKIAGVELCRSYRRQYGLDCVSVMPPNVYGEDDHFDDTRGGHVMASLIRRIAFAKRAGAREITIWGTGTPRREFLHADDLADGLVFLADRPDAPQLINIGWGRDIQISALAALIADALDWRGTIRVDPSKPDGTPRKLLDVSQITALGWAPTIPLRQGVRRAARHYLARFATPVSEISDSLDGAVYLTATG